MIITARASHLPQAPRKINLVVKSIVGLPATKALDKLQFTVKRASNPIAKVLRQAIANATNNHKLDPKNLFIDTAFATKGRVLKRSMVGGRSRQKPYERTASHLTINLRSVTPKPLPVIARSSATKQSIQIPGSPRPLSGLAMTNKSNLSNPTNKSNKTNTKKTK